MKKPKYPTLDNVFNSHEIEIGFHQDYLTKEEYARITVDVLGKFYGKIKRIGSPYKEKNWLYHRVFNRQDVEDWAIKCYLNLLKKLCEGL